MKPKRICFLSFAPKRDSLTSTSTRVKSPHPPPPSSPQPFTGLSWMAVIFPSTTHEAAATRWATGSFCSAIYAVEDGAQQSRVTTSSASPAQRIAFIELPSCRAEQVGRLTSASVAMLRAGPPMLVAGPPLAAASQPIPVPVNPLTATAPDRPPRLGTPRRSSADAGLLPDGHSLVETVDLAPWHGARQGAARTTAYVESTTPHPSACPRGPWRTSRSPTVPKSAGLSRASPAPRQGAFRGRPICAGRVSASPSSTTKSRTVTPNAFASACTLPGDTAHASKPS